MRASFHFPGPVYPIADGGGSSGRSPLDVVTAALAGGCRLVQLRMKHTDTRTFVDVARAAQTLADRYAAALIINDRADVARLVGAAGVHLGQDDLPLFAARTLLGPKRIIGTSTHTLEQLTEAVRAGMADYVAYGPIFPTTSKERVDPVQGLDALRRARRTTTLPLVAIGGISVETIGDVLATGADAAAVIGAIANAADPLAAVRALQSAARASQATADRDRRGS